VAAGVPPDSSVLMPVQGILRWTQRMLFACAVLLLGYCTFVLVNAWVFQKRANATLERLVRDQAAAPASPKEAPLVASGDLIGRIEIPRLSLSVVVVEGTDKPALRRAAGHIVGTGLPGQPGNVGLAGHRDTFFRPLRNIQRNDIITLTTLRGEYRYRVVSTKVVSPYDVAVLNPDGNEILTLVTCYPFYFVGPAPDRFIVRAERVTGYPEPL
jgi:sortase A